MKYEEVINDRRSVGFGDKKIDDRKRGRVGLLQGLGRDYVIFHVHGVGGLWGHFLFSMNASLSFQFLPLYAPVRRPSCPELNSIIAPSWRFSPSYLGVFRRVIRPSWRFSPSYL